MECKQGKKEEVQDRGDVKPAEHGDGKRTCKFLRPLIGRLSLPRKLGLYTLAVEEDKPPSANQKGNAVNPEQKPANHLHALRRQSRRKRIGRELREKCNRDPDEAEKDRKATPNQNGDARPVAKINESNAGCHTEEGQTDQKALSPHREGSHRRRKFGGGVRQLDKQQSERCD